MQKAVSAAQSNARHVWLTVVSAAAIVGISMGLRQVMGLYLPPMTKDLGISREAFGLAIALANLVWGLGAPVAGAISDRFGAGRVIVAGALSTMLGLYLMQAATSEAALIVSGILLGVGISGTGITSLVGVVGRNVPPERRTSAIAAVSVGGGSGRADRAALYARCHRVAGLEGFARRARCHGRTHAAARLAAGWNAQSHCDRFTAVDGRGAARGVRPSQFLAADGRLLRLWFSPRVLRPASAGLRCGSRHAVQRGADGAHARRHLQHGRHLAGREVGPVICRSTMA